jgi:glutathione synthase
MNLLFVADPLVSFSVEKDSTLAMMQAAQSAGHTIWHCHVEDIKSIHGSIYAKSQRIQVDRTMTPWYAYEEVQQKKVSSFDAVIMRKDPPFDMSYVTATWFLSQAKLEGAKIFNDPAALRNHSEKLSLLEFLQYAPPTLISYSLSDIQNFHREHQDIIIKPLDGMGGMGIFRVKSDGLNLASIVETLGYSGQRALMTQKFLPEIADGDKRVLVIGGQAIPHALARIPQGGEVRGNLAAGGKGVACPIASKEAEVVSHMGPILAARGLHLVGLDFIGGYLTEINVTSPTCFVEITQQTGYDVAKHWLMSLEQQLI